MKLIDIRDRMLLAAVLPVVAVSTLLSLVFLFGRLGDIDEAHAQRARSLARQVASASEYGIFVGDRQNLQSIAAGALREADVVSVVIRDVAGHVLAREGVQGYAIPPEMVLSETRWNEAASGNDIWVQPVKTAQITLDDLFENGSPHVDKRNQAVGHVLIEMSRKQAISRERDMLLAGLMVTLGGLLFGGFLAVSLGRGVIRPVQRVADMVERIGRGELSVRGEIKEHDPLRDLQAVLNQMAARLEQGRDELERRVLQATLELRERKEEAETATQAKSLFLAAASHDLRQPTHALGLFVARLAQLPHDAQTLALIGNLENSLRAMQDLLDALLDISRLDAHAVKVNPNPFPIEDILALLRNGLMPVALDKGLELRVRASPQWVMSDPSLLHRILLNLVSNALSYTHKGGVVVACRLRDNGRQLRIEVWDSGIGIAPEHWQDVYKEFFQLGNTARDRNKGLGLGLSIVHRMAKLLGYRLELVSRPGTGTRFSIEVPVTAPQTQAVQMIEARGGQPLDDLSGLRVLMIEDDSLVARALTSLLESWGCHVVQVDALSPALQKLETGFKPDVIVSDYRLRDEENGLDTVHRLRQVLVRQVPACLISGDTDPELIQQARMSGLTLLHKPVRVAKLRSLIRRLVMEDRAWT